MAVLLIIIIGIVLIVLRKTKNKKIVENNVSTKDSEKKKDNAKPSIIKKDVEVKKTPASSLSDSHSWLWSIFHIKDLNSTITNLKAQNEELDTNNQKLEKEANIKLTLKQMEPQKLDKMIFQKQNELQKLIDDKNTELTKLIESKKDEELKLDNKIVIKKNDITNKEQKIDELTKQLSDLQSQIIDISTQLEYEDNGLYEPHYDFANSSAFKGKLSEVRANQKRMIKTGDAAIIFTPLTMNGSEAQGRRMQKKNIKQLLRSFNGECEAAINKVTKSNIETVEKKINHSFDQLNKLNDPNGVRITTGYLDSKLDEAHIALEYALKKEQEKEILREQKEREREERKLQRQIATERAKYEKDETHYEQAKELVNKKIAAATSDVEIVSLKKELAKLQEKLNEVNEKKIKLTDRAENPTAGYVYIISNIGSFGHKVFKIGVTRRLDPMERIRELGSASVPFKFDVHALIFSDDAFKLEKELHDYFDRQRVNKVNKRKEFFKIDMQEIKHILEQHKELTFDFHEVPEAPEYRDSLLIEQQQNENTEVTA